MGKLFWRGASVGDGPGLPGLTWKLPSTQGFMQALAFRHPAIRCRATQLANEWQTVEFDMP